MDQAQSRNLAELDAHVAEYNSDQSPNVRTDTNPRRDAGSFRDPNGFVCHHEGKVYRVVDESFSHLFDQLQRSGLLQQLFDDGLLIGSRRISDDEHVLSELGRIADPSATGAHSVLHHERVPFISYPYEWSPGMLADAALCTLDLQLRLMSGGYNLKDATAYNVQFIGSQPVFVDVTSIESVQRKDVWTALDQFYRMFLYPLLLSHYGRCQSKPYFLSHLDGMEPDDVQRCIGRVSALRPGLLLDLWLPCQLKRWANRKPNQLRHQVDVNRDDTKPLEINLKRLRHKIQKLAEKRHSGGTWLGYENDNCYDEAAEDLKRTFVERHLTGNRPARVLDIGCNTGAYSRLAAESGAAVVALDSDTACIDNLYRNARDNRLNILPLVMNIANPSPGIGFRNIERQSFLDRASFDCVLALALIHHLHITANLPLDSIRDLLADLTEDVLIIEFIEPTDSMFKQLRGSRADDFADFTIERCSQSFTSRFDLIEQVAVTPHRTIAAYRKRQ
ncbi:MAG: 50S ribosomal protein L11 methyltransferase [Phycisphaerae bacterium]|nr:MAG: 50S ribosomal protein L11 methyltransferase [Phycisphaerae bacterium]